MANENTGFRNGNLFCFNCGESQTLPLPMRVELATDFMMSFSKLHRKCPNTWIEPQNVDALINTEEQNCDWWIKNGEHGISSKTMFNFLSDGLKIENRELRTPSDPDDFRRCHLLLEAIPQFRGKLDRMKSVDQTWANLVENWDRLTEMLLENIAMGKPNGMLEFMKKLGC